MGHLAGLSLFFVYACENCHCSLSEPDTYTEISCLCTLAKTAVVLRRELQKGDMISSYITSMSQVKREAFSGLSTRNRGVLEKESGQSRSSRQECMDLIYSQRPNSC